MSWEILFLCGLVGMTAGSFSTTVGMRMAEGRGWMLGRSACDGCHRPLGLAETVPCLSYAVLRGRCASCGGRIPPTHFVGEVIGGAGLPVLISTSPPSSAIVAFILLMSLLAIAVADMIANRVPDQLVAPVLLAGTFLSWSRGLPALEAGAISALATLAVLGGLRLLGKKDGASWLGGGDVKLAAALAMWLGPHVTWAVGLGAAAALFATLYRRGSNGAPLGAYLAPAAAAVGFATQWTALGSVP